MSNDILLPATTARWVFPRQRISVAGVSIEHGLFYVRGAAGIHEVDAIGGPEHLAADAHELDWCAWPSSTRRRYLEWLAAGRPDSSGIDSFVRHAVAGFERRMLTEGDLALTVGEVTRMREVLRRFETSSYVLSSTAASCSRAQRLLDVVCSTSFVAAAVSGVGDSGIACEIGSLLLAGRQVPMELALTAITLPPASSAIAEEFDQLFRIRFAERGGVGLNGIGADIRYVPLNAALPNEVSIWTDGDPFIESAAAQACRSLADGCLSELRPFEYIVRCSGAAAAKREAFGLLPLPLIRQRHGDELRQLVAFADHALRDKVHVAIAYRDLLKYWPCGGDVTSGAAKNLAVVLEEHGMGIEPDPRRSGVIPTRDESVILFRPLPDVATDELLAYERGSRIVAHVVAAAKRKVPVLTEAQVAELESLTSESVGLRGAGRTRLHHSFTAVAASRPRRSLPPPPFASKQLIDSILDRATLITAGRTVRGKGSDVISRTDTNGFAIPPRPTLAPTKSVPLRSERIDELRSESAQLAEVFSDVFVADDSPPISQPQHVPAKHIKLLQRLAERSVWTTAEFTAEFGLYPEAACEQINEFTEHTAGATYIEVSEDISIDCAAAQRFLKEIQS